jgi:hypothetical protein
MQLMLARFGPHAGDDERAAAVLREFAGELPPLTGHDVWQWLAPSSRASLAGAAHSRDRTGGVVEYRSADATRGAMFSGRPILWDGGNASGTTAIAAARFLDPPERWAEQIDGRCAIMRYDDSTGTLTIRTDPLGSYPVYAADEGPTTWVSNSAALLRRLIDSRDMRPDVLATFAGCGWALGGSPLWAGVDRLARGALHEWRPQSRTARELLPTETLAKQFGAGFSADRASADLAATIKAASQWPGRPVVLPLTGGRDSRVIFAGALAADVDFAAETSGLPHLPGYPDTADVRIARELCNAVNRPHAVNLPQSRTFSAATVIPKLTLASPGTFSLAGISPGTAANFADAEHRPATPLRILLSGASGETARTYYGLGDGMSNAQLSDLLLSRLIPRYPPALLSSAGRAVVRDYVDGWVGEARDRGVSARDVPDLFYLLERMSNWAGPLHGILEFGADVVAPLWTPRMVRHQIALSGEQRTAGQFHALLVEHLAPHLAVFEYEGATYEHGRIAHLRKRIQQAKAEVTRRRGKVPPQPGDPLPAALPLIRERVLSLGDHPMWAVLDRRRVARVLQREAHKLDPRSRDQVWRLATASLAAD